MSRNEFSEIIKSKVHVEYIHQDRFSDDTTSLGMTLISLTEVMDGKLASTSHSTVRALDTYVTINKGG